MKPKVRKLNGVWCVQTGVIHRARCASWADAVSLALTITWTVDHYR